ncbi:MAG TPA: hypothetical protein PKD91_00930 [Bacteroidia bacterium]|nr:hypothetical protein [Bacteroidia bacterium]
MDKILLEKLCCPFTGASLIESAGFLVSTDAHTRYRYKIEDGIPILLKENAEVLDEQEWNAVMNKQKSK